MMNPYSILIAVAVFAASLAGVGVWQNHAGHMSERAQWESREVAQLTAANAKIVELEEAARNTEFQRSLQLTAISQHYEKEKIDAKVQRDRDVAAARGGAIRLSVNAACKSSGAGNVPGVAAGPGIGDAAASRVDLPGEVTASLLAIADDADAITGQLRECQAIVSSDRAPVPK